MFSPGGVEQREMTVTTVTNPTKSEVGDVEIPRFAPPSVHVYH